MSAPMPGWLILATIATVAITALLAWLLWRINLPQQSGEGETVAAPAAGVDSEGD
jgi:hypothetical protein